MRINAQIVAYVKMYVLLTIIMTEAKISPNQLLMPHDIKICMKWKPAVVVLLL